MLEETPFLNAVHDCLIRYEIDFIRQNTNLPISFISNDKDQCKSALQEGIDAIHIKKPNHTPGIETRAAENLDMERIRTLLFSLLTHSAAVRLTSQKGEYFLSWTWWGRSMDDISEHKIRIIDPTGKLLVVDP